MGTIDIAGPGRLDDEAACMRLCIDFANHLDARRYESVLDLFTEEATLDRMGTILPGRAEIARFLAARPADVATRHLCTNLRVHFDAADEATGFCYVLFCQGTDGQLSARPSVVEYHDRYQRTAKGWRIRERRIRMALQG